MKVSVTIGYTITCSNWANQNYF